MVKLTVDLDDPEEVGEKNSGYVGAWILQAETLL